MTETQIRKRLVSYFKNNKLHYIIGKSNDTIISSFRTNNSEIEEVKIIIIIQDNLYSVIAKSPVSADTKDIGNLQRVSEFVLRANWKMKRGCFDFDVDNGDIYYRYTVDVFSSELNDDVIDLSIFLPVSMIAKYTDGLVRVIDSRSSPLEIIRKIENNSGSSLESVGGIKP